MAAKEMRVGSESRLRPAVSAVCRFDKPRLEVDGRHRLLYHFSGFYLVDVHPKYSVGDLRWS